MRMMKTLHAESATKPWFKQLFVDFDKRPFSLSTRYYDVSELRLRGVSVNDFLEANVSWSTLRALGYRIGDMKLLGGTLDDIKSMGVHMSHLVDEHEHVNPSFVLPLVSHAGEVAQWTPAELFKMGFTFQQLLDVGLNQRHFPLSAMQLFYSPNVGQRMAWGSEVSVSAPVSAPVGASSGPVGGPYGFDTLSLSEVEPRPAARLKIDVTRFK